VTGSHIGQGQFAHAAVGSSPMTLAVREFITAARASVRAFNDPQIWYVATRSLRSLSPEWFRVGGFIVLSGPALSLRSLSGLSMDAELSGTGGFAFQTPLGDGVEITIASLHPYAASPLGAANEELPTVRFCRPPPSCVDAADQPCTLREICSVGVRSTPSRFPSVLS
jgi:hypothetical protein